MQGWFDNLKLTF